MGEFSAGKVKGKDCELRSISKDDSIGTQVWPLQLCDHRYGTRHYCINFYQIELRYELINQTVVHI